MFPEMQPDDSAKVESVECDGSTGFEELAGGGKPTVGGATPYGCGPVIIDFRALAKTKKEVFIRLDGETYRLCLTRNNKLILTK